MFLLVDISTYPVFIVVERVACLQDDSKPPQCCLCPIEGGALKPTTEAGLWCHATCMHWIPEVSAVDERRMEPVTGIKSIQKERWELNCCICKCVISPILAFSRCSCLRCVGVRSYSLQEVESS